jgi:hypothetical protein
LAATQVSERARGNNFHKRREPCLFVFPDIRIFKNLIFRQDWYVVSPLLFCFAVEELFCLCRRLVGLLISLFPCGLVILVTDFGFRSMWHRKENREVELGAIGCF